MRRGSSWLLLAWPGLPHLWVRGSWAGLALAAGFAVLASVLLASWLVWTAWLPQSVQFVGFGLAVVAWGGSALVALRSRMVPEPRRESGDERSETEMEDLAAECQTLLRRAQSQYLQGDWVAVERTLGQLLEQDARDVEARLFLATVCRHRDRLEEASDHLTRLERLEAADRWSYEIEAERERLARRASTQTAPNRTPDLADEVCEPANEVCEPADNVREPADNVREPADEVPETVSFSHDVAENRRTGPSLAVDRGLPMRPNADTIGRTDAA